jgi:hypothetical protein
MPAPFMAALAERPLLADSAMGPVLCARGVPLDTCFDVLNVSDPKIVQGIHVGAALNPAAAERSFGRLDGVAEVLEALG